MIVWAALTNNISRTVHNRVHVYCTFFFYLSLTNESSYKVLLPPCRTACIRNTSSRIFTMFRIYWCITKCIWSRPIIRYLFSSLIFSTQQLGTQYMRFHALYSPINLQWFQTFSTQKLNDLSLITLRRIVDNKYNFKVTVLKIVIKYKRKNCSI